MPWMEIVGVVGDVLPGLGVDPQSEMYLPYRQADALLARVPAVRGAAHCRRAAPASRRVCAAPWRRSIPINPL